MKELLFAESKGFSVNKVCEGLYKQTKTVALEWMDEMIPTLRHSRFTLFYQTGNRSVYEKEYFARRARLNAFALVSFIDQSPEMKEALEDTIWAICDEFTWALPAHIPQNTPMEQYASCIDLFAAETAFALSEISHILKDSLSDVVKQRIHFEVRRRIIDHYLSERPLYGWETSRSNWSAVCAGSVGAAFLYIAREDEIAAALEKISVTMQYYLSGFGDDGACLEGYAYWRYGFGFFASFASLLRQYTNGEVDWFAQEKVHRIAQFQQAVILNGDGCVNFSDSNSDFWHNVGLSCFLHREYHDVPAQSVQNSADFYKDHCYRWCNFIRNFVWADESADNANPIEEHTYILENAGWYIKKMADFCFAAKAGCNGEPHNHNDVGSFIIRSGSDEIICELGCGEYTREYFDPKTRYDYLVNSSRGHSLPILNGGLQKSGEEYKGVITTYGDDVFEVEMADAYAKGCISSLRRRFDFADGQIKLTDRFVFSQTPESITERFITKIKPVLLDGRVVIQGVCLSFDAQNYACNIHEETFSAHNCACMTAYMIDFSCTVPSKECRFEMTVRRVG